MRVGLVLGAGGVQGGAWLTGALDALAEQTGWDPATADVVVGTSAGSVIGSLCVAGIPPWFMVAHSAGETFEGIADARGQPGRRGRPHRRRALQARARLAADRPRLVAAGAAHPSRAPSLHPGHGLLRMGPARADLDRAAEGDRSAASCPRAGADHPAHWVVACDYATGRRVAFGRDDAPPADLADAVAASCAIPAFYSPGLDQRHGLRRRRHLLGLEPRPPSRPRPRPGDLPQPDLEPAPAPRARSARVAATSPSDAPPAGASAARRRSCERTAPRWC